MSWQDEYRDFFALTEIEVVAKRKAFILEYVHTPLKPRLFKRNAGVSEDALAVVRPRRANAPSNLQETVHTSGPRCGTPTKLPEPPVLPEVPAANASWLARIALAKQWQTKRIAQLERLCIEQNSEALYKWAVEKSGLATPVGELEQKHGRGIFRRFFYWIPSKGVGAVDRLRLRKYKCDGTARLHEFADIGVPGTVSSRRASCHMCKACWANNRRACENLEYQPLAPGSTTYSLSDVTVLVPARRVRIAGVELKVLRSNRSPRFAIEAESLRAIRAEMRTSDDSFTVEAVVQYRSYYRKEQWLVK
ncbi:hypothetical protein T492DRAFT_1141756 [Pavlovales sp. CCMP2436]|nr:hypothetical protein T492DRAFT_1141756 [Pavlovales sp. CCMP2436]